jgi:hypothetical protein
MGFILLGSHHGIRGLGGMRRYKIQSWDLLYGVTGTL